MSLQRRDFYKYNVFYTGNQCKILIMTRCVNAVVNRCELQGVTRQKCLSSSQHTFAMSGFQWAGQNAPLRAWSSPVWSIIIFPCCSEFLRLPLAHFKQPICQYLCSCDSIGLSMGWTSMCISIICSITSLCGLILPTSVTCMPELVYNQPDYSLYYT